MNKPILIIVQKKNIINDGRYVLKRDLKCDKIILY